MKLGVALNTLCDVSVQCSICNRRHNPPTVVDPGENLTGALHSHFGRGGCGGRG